MGKRALNNVIDGWIAEPSLRKRQGVSNDQVVNAIERAQSIGG
jgi:hypothetical protein